MSELGHFCRFPTSHISIQFHSIFNPSAVTLACDKCSFERDLEIDIETQTKEKHTECFKCRFCDFFGKSEGGLKTHMRFKHTKKMDQLNWKLEV
jgi:hypothetical protein